MPVINDYDMRINVFRIVVDVKAVFFFFIIVFFFHKNRKYYRVYCVSNKHMWFIIFLAI